MHTSESFTKGAGWMVLSATSLALSFFFLKLMLGELDYFLLLFLRFFLPWLLVVLFLMLQWKWKHLFTAVNLPLQIVRSLCVLVAQYSLAYYMTQNSLLNATLLINASPIFIPLLEWAYLKHKPGRSTLIGITVSFFGVLLVLHPDKSLFSAMSGIGLLAALGQASSQVLYGQKSKTENSSTSIFYLFFFTSLFSFLVLLWLKPLPLPSTDRTIPLFVLGMALGSLFNQYFRGLAYRHGRPSNLSTFLYFSVLVSALLDYFVLDEPFSPTTLIGALLIILGGLLKILLRAHILKK